MNKRRWLDIIDNLSETTPTTSEFLGLQLGLSGRTIRKELKNMNQHLISRGAHLDIKPKSGVLLQIEDRHLFESFLVELKDIKGVPQTSSERIQYLIETLLMQVNETINLDDLSDQLYVSRSTIDYELKEVKKVLEAHNLDLVNKRGQGIFVKGKELDLRLCLASFTLSRLNQDDIIKNGTLKRIEACIQSGLRSSDIEINNVSYQNLLIHLYIALERISDENYVSLDTEELRQVIGDTEYFCARNIVACLGDEFNIEIPDSEIVYIAIHLGSKQIMNYGDQSENVVIDEKVNNMIDRMFKEVRDSYKIDFADDLELRISLAMHLLPFSIRIKYGMNMMNPLIKDIKQRYLFAFMLATTACQPLEHEYQRSISDDEIGYFALHFNLALERKNHNTDKKNILIVCSTGKGSAQMLMWNIRERFGSQLGTIQTCDVNQVKNYDTSLIDYIFTTVSIPYPLDRPIVHINIFFNESDEVTISNSLKEKMNFPLEKYLTEEMFIPLLEARTKEDVISKMISHVSNYREVPENFEDLILQREKMGATAFGNMIALPHPSQMTETDSFICISVLEKPIEWGEHKVQLVIMIAVKESSKKDIQDFFRIISRLLLDQESIYDLIRKRDYLTLLSLLKKIEKEITY